VSGPLRLSDVEIVIVKASRPPAKPQNARRGAARMSTRRASARRGYPGRARRRSLADGAGYGHTMSVVRKPGPVGRNIEGRSRSKLKSEA